MKIKLICVFEFIWWFYILNCRERCFFDVLVISILEGVLVSFCLFCFFCFFLFCFVLFCFVLFGLLICEPFHFSFFFFFFFFFLGAMASSRDSIYLQKRETMVILDSFLQNKSQGSPLFLFLFLFFSFFSFFNSFPFVSFPKAPPGAPVSHEKTPFLPSLGLNRRGRRGKREREKLKNKKEEDRSIFGRSLEVISKF